MLFPKKKQKRKKEMFYMNFVSHCCCGRYFPATIFKKHDSPLFYFLNQVLKGHARYRILHNLWMKSCNITNISYSVRSLRSKKEWCVKLTYIKKSSSLHEAHLNSLSTFGDKIASVLLHTSKETVVELKK